ncbi:hypothetical protein K432DRAFT_399532 [Lepidopterella palustris CBS 459.81]|uniref:AMP-dependent synthetase/ligase domain-containing protein n=1 Tax=Lepidopterella palustris CBS 459.81 TaxID=1314670 RepID=A0A8E2EM02_9PEZI|nr:hypothetical protein K432DRAFT_399532 [Lepidopterella palustris CBS 459.81]
MGSFPQLSEAYGGDLGPIPTYLKLISMVGRQYPDNLAVISLHQAEDTLSSLHGSRPGHVQWTFSQLKHGAETLADRLRCLGFQDRTPIIAILPNQAEWALLFWTAAILRTCFGSPEPIFSHKYGRGHTYAWDGRPWGYVRQRHTRRQKCSESVPDTGCSMDNPDYLPLFSSNETEKPDVARIRPVHSETYLHCWRTKWLERRPN